MLDRVIASIFRKRLEDLDRRWAIRQAERRAAERRARPAGGKHSRRDRRPLARKA